MIRFWDHQSSAPFMANEEFADLACQLEEILFELNQVSDPTLRIKMLGTLRLLMTEANRLTGQEAAS